MILTEEMKNRQFEAELTVTGGIVAMNMKETETDILNDLEELDDTISQYTYLLTCARECSPMREEEHTEEHLIRECQVKTWIYTHWDEGKLYLEADSESLIVKGALALLQEIYYGRTREEIREYHCSLLEYDGFTKHFTREQLKGLRVIITQLELIS